MPAFDISQRVEQPLRISLLFFSVPSQATIILSAVQQGILLGRQLQPRSRMLTMPLPHLQQQPSLSQTRHAVQLSVPLRDLSDLGLAAASERFIEDHGQVLQVWQAFLICAAAASPKVDMPCCTADRLIVEEQVSYFGV